MSGGGGVDGVGSRHASVDVRHADRVGEEGTRAQMNAGPDCGHAVTTTRDKTRPHEKKSRTTATTTVRQPTLARGRRTDDGQRKKIRKYSVRRSFLGRSRIFRIRLGVKTSDDSVGSIP